MNLTRLFYHVEGSLKDSVASIALLWHINAKAKGPPASSNTTSSPVKPQQMTLSHTPESPGPFTNFKKKSSPGIELQGTCQVCNISTKYCINKQKAGEPDSTQFHSHAGRQISPLDMQSYAWFRREPYSEESSTITYFLELTFTPLLYFNHTSCVALLVFGSSQKKRMILYSSSLSSKADCQVIQSENFPRLSLGYMFQS